MRIDGYFNTNDEPAIQLDLGAGAIEILVDTGFAGNLILPLWPLDWLSTLKALNNSILQRGRY